MLRDLINECLLFRTKDKVVIGIGIVMWLAILFLFLVPDLVDKFVF